MSQSVHRTGDVIGTASCARDLRTVAEGLHHLVGSAEPTVVFSSLARLCIPGFSDECTVDLAEDGRPGHRIAYPCGDAAGAGSALGEPAPAGTNLQVCTAVESLPEDVGPAYSGVIVHSWASFVPGPAESLVARLMADRAVAAISHARTGNQVERALEAAENLRIALQTNRRIGIAIGILMALQKTTDTGAFELLAKASQRGNRKLRDVADEVIQIGCLPRA